MSGPLSLGWRLRATGAVLVVPPLLWFVSLSRVAAWVGSSSRAPSRAGSVDDAALAQWVDLLLGWLPGLWHRSCLKRATVLYGLLRRAGRPVELWIGVSRGRSHALAAHAWLVRDGVPYLEPDPQVPGAHSVIAQFPLGANRNLVSCTPRSS